jgi:hypothetical protein
MEVGCDKIKLLAVNEASRVWRKMARFIHGCFKPLGVVSETFDLHAPRYVPEDVDVLVGWSSSSMLAANRTSNGERQRGADPQLRVRRVARATSWPSKMKLLRRLQRRHLRLDQRE